MDQERINAMAKALFDMGMLERTTTGGRRYVAERLLAADDAWRAAHAPEAARTVAGDALAEAVVKYDLYGGWGNVWQAYSVYRSASAAPPASPAADPWTREQVEALVRAAREYLSVSMQTVVHHLSDPPRREALLTALAPFAALAEQDGDNAPPVPAPQPGEAPAAGAPAPDAGEWWCPDCKVEIASVNVTYQETHDERAGGCGCHVIWREKGSHSGEVAAPTPDRLTANLSTDTVAERFWCVITPASGLCSLCRGSGSLMCFQDGAREFWTCPACGGAGARALFAPRTIGRLRARAAAGDGHG